jgi:hypothetical protein
MVASAVHASAVRRWSAPRVVSAKRCASAGASPSSGVIDRADRKDMRVVLDDEAPFVRARREFDLAGLQFFSIRGAQKWREHLAAQRWIGRMPVHVEEARMRCVASPFEDTLPPRILRSADSM